MLKTTAAAALTLVLAVACASAPMNSSATTGGASATIASNPNDAPEFVLLSSPNQVRTYDYSQTVYGFHIRGTMTNKGFIPAGNVQGRGKFCADGKDWLSLSDLKVHKAGDAQPSGAYVLGCSSTSGFQPASRDIVTQ